MSPSDSPHHSTAGDHTCCTQTKKPNDVVFIGSSTTIGIAYLTSVLGMWQYIVVPKYIEIFTQTIFELLNAMWWGILIGIIFVGIMDRIPRHVLIAIFGRGGTFQGLIRATAAGVLLDLCSHGILLVGMKLYQRGASLGQVMAFLIASPWNSLSLTLIMIALIGIQWTVLFLGISLLIALVSGWIFDYLVTTSHLPQNPYQDHSLEETPFWSTTIASLKNADFSAVTSIRTMQKAFIESKMILRWIFLGTILAAILRSTLSPDQFQVFFGPTFLGLCMTLIVATILEVCSEGSVPIAADLLSRAAAPGNAFAFLMTGVSTDYTEILTLREATKSWKIAVFLPLITTPQIVLIAWIINLASST